MTKQHFDHPKKVNNVVSFFGGLNCHKRKQDQIFWMKSLDCTTGPFFRRASHYAGDMIGKNVQLHVILSSQGSSKKRRLLNAAVTAEGLKKGDIFAPDNPLLDQIIGQLLSHQH